MPRRHWLPKAAAAALRPLFDSQHVTGDCSEINGHVGTVKATPTPAHYNARPRSSLGSRPLPRWTRRGSTRPAQLQPGNSMLQTSASRARRRVGAASRALLNGGYGLRIGHNVLLTHSPGDACTNGGWERELRGSVTAHVSLLPQALLAVTGNEIQRLIPLKLRLQTQQQPCPDKLQSAYISTFSGLAQQAMDLYCYIRSQRVGSQRRP